MLADPDCPAICVRLAVTAHISAAQHIGWDLTAGYLFPVVTTEGNRGGLPLSAARMTATLQGHLFAVGIAAELCDDAFLRVGDLYQISHWEGGGHHKTRWLEYGVDSKAVRRGHL